MTTTPSSDPAALVTELRAALADIETHVQQRAEALARPRIADADTRAELARQQMETGIEKVQHRAEMQAIEAEQHHHAVLAEAQKQIDILERQVAQADWIARYLPGRLGREAHTNARRHGYQLLTPEWVARADRLAEASGLDIHAHPERHRFPLPATTTVP